MKPQLCRVFVNWHETKESLAHCLQVHGARLRFLLNEYVVLELIIGYYGTTGGIKAHTASTTNKNKVQNLHICIVISIQLFATYEQHLY
jgi:hypothetical protein